MCGISGIYDSSAEPVNQDTLLAMTHALTHRGPDNTGIWTKENIGLGHTRLSIIDLTQMGHQPMVSNDGQVALTYNGELYNFCELKKELEALGAHFKSRSDTEVVLWSYLIWGIDAFKKMDGMFALAIWDGRKKNLVLARDRFGVKPLYYTHIANKFLFGSEIKALLVSGVVARQISYQGLHEYMWFGNALGKTTCYEGIFKLLPGHYLTISQEKLSLASYWDVSQIPRVTDTYAEATKQVGFLLEEAVKSQIVSDVPVGIFLSGGIDSSAILAFTKKNYAHPLKTFSVGFEGADATNELSKARQVAAFFKTDHHEFLMQGKNMQPVIEQLVGCHDEPFADAANIPLYLLSQHLKGEVKVILQGDGGDEIFAGYRRYNVLRYLKWWRLANRIGLSKFMALQKRSSRFLTAINQQDPVMRMSLLLTQEDYHHSPARLFNQDVRSRLDTYDPFLRYRDLFSAVKTLDPVTQMLFIDSAILLPDTFLEKVDKSTMAHSIEVRVPFLSHKITDYVMGLPSAYKVKYLSKKRILKKALRGTVPDAILDAPKMGFNVPYSYWLKTDLSEYMRSVLLDGNSCNGMFDKALLETHINEHISGKRNHGFLLWKALHLTLWEKRYLGRVNEKG